MELLQWENVTSSFTAGAIVFRAPACRWKYFFSDYMNSHRELSLPTKITFTCGAAPSATAPEEMRENPEAVQHPMLAAARHANPDAQLGNLALHTRSSTAQRTQHEAGRTGKNSRHRGELLESCWQRCTTKSGQCKPWVSVLVHLTPQSIHAAPQ